ncbi:unnamed protein product [Microthlaspi erraticum]|uniref:Uncharacterized protein n=1 Tax=Microthlaspi erraticum TaxID=1685480 RepID=A0A6D2JEL1_9BRAS|nr:unnamed protein product [Microthlaspi erraticum]
MVNPRDNTTSPSLEGINPGDEYEPATVDKPLHTEDRDRSVPPKSRSASPKGRSTSPSKSESPPPPPTRSRRTKKSSSNAKFLRRREDGRETISRELRLNARQAEEDPGAARRRDPRRRRGTVGSRCRDD